MAQSLLEMAKDLVQALIENKLLPSADMRQELSKTHASLLELKAQEDRDAVSEADREEHIGRISGASDWKQSIKKHMVECLVCGKTFKQLQPWFRAGSRS